MRNSNDSQVRNLERILKEEFSRETSMIFVLGISREFSMRILKRNPNDSPIKNLNLIPENDFSQEIQNIFSKVIVL